MKKELLFAAALVVLPLCAGAQEMTERLDSVVISASRAGDKTPVTHTDVGKEALRASNPSFSLPMALELLKDPEHIARLEENAEKMALREAAQVICDEVYRILR